MHQRLTKSKYNRVLSGVCGGFAEFIGWDPTLVRLLTLITMLVTGILPGIIVYLVLWLIMPEDN